MTELTDFTKPDVAPSYFIEFLEFLDNTADIKRQRAESNKRMKVAKGNKILDLGCGIGGATFPIADAVGPSGLAAGVDLSPAMIKVASDRAKGRAGIEFRIADACSIPYADGFFDAARSERLFLYLPDRLAAIHEMKRVVKSGGCVCLVDTDLDSTAVYSKNRELMRKMTSLVAASVPNPNSGRELPALAKQAGLKHIETDVFAMATPHSFFLRAIAGSLSQAAEKGIVARSEVDECLAEQASLHETGDFFQIWMMVLVSGTV